MGIWTQFKAITGADCSSITIRWHLQGKGFRNQIMSALMPHNCPLMVLITFSFIGITRKSHLQCFLCSIVGGIIILRACSFSTAELQVIREVKQALWRCCNGHLVMDGKRSSKNVPDTGCLSWSHLRQLYMVLHFQPAVEQPNFLFSINFSAQKLLSFTPISHFSIMKLFLEPS